MTSYVAAFTLLLAAATVARAQTAETASGTLSVGDQTYPLKYAYAIPEDIASGGQSKAVWVLLLDASLPPFVEEDGMTQRQLGAEGKIHGVQFHLDAAGKIDRDAMLFHPAWRENMSIPDDMVQYTSKPSGATKVAGSVKESGVAVEDIKVQFKCTFETGMYQRPAPLTGAAAAASGPGKVVAASWAAVAKKDKATLRGLVTGDALSALDGPDADKLLEMMAMMHDPATKILRVYQVGDVALVEAGGGGSEESSRLVRIKGDWKLTQ